MALTYISTNLHTHTFTLDSGTRNDKVKKGGGDGVELGRKNWNKQWGKITGKDVGHRVGNTESGTKRERHSEGSLRQALRL